VEDADADDYSSCQTERMLLFLYHNSGSFETMMETSAMAMRRCDGAVPSSPKIILMDLDVIKILIGSEVSLARGHLSYGIRSVPLAGT
jgi:hypothetical protein